MKNALQGGARGEQRPRIPSSLAAAASVYSPPPSTPPSLDCRNDLCGKVRSSSVSKTRTMNLLSFPLYSGFMLLLLLPPKYYSCEASYSLSMDPEDRECISVRVPKRPSVIRCVQPQSCCVAKCYFLCTKRTLELPLQTDSPDTSRWNICCVCMHLGVAWLQFSF